MATKPQPLYGLNFSPHSSGGVSGPRKSLEDDFVAHWDEVVRQVHANARAKGFWDKERHISELLAEIHGEVSEVLEAAKHGNPESEKTPGFSKCEEELADVVIRIMDLAAGRKWDIAGAIVAKIRHNATRERLHGKEF